MCCRTTDALLFFTGIWLLSRTNVTLTVMPEERSGGHRSYSLSPGGRVGKMNDCKRFHDNPSNSCRDISFWTKHVSLTCEACWGEVRGKSVGFMLQESEAGIFSLWAEKKKKKNSKWVGTLQFVQPRCLIILLITAFMSSARDKSCE